MAAGSTPPGPREALDGRRLPATDLVDVSVVATNRDSGRGFRHDDTIDVPVKPEDTWRALVREFELPAGVTQVRVAVRDATSADGLNVIVNSGRAAGQTIDHVHWHVIPRFQDDSVNWPWPHTEYLGDELGQMQFRLQRELSPKADD